MLADYPVEQSNDGRANQSIIIDNGKYIAAVTICAVTCGLCLCASIWAISEQHKLTSEYRENYLDTQDEYQKERNHVIELEARQKALADELQEMKHERR